MSRPNRYPGACSCGAHVAAGAGTLGRKVGRRWTVHCASCVEPPKSSGCATCSGEGRLYGGRLCSACDGTGADMTATRAILAERAARQRGSTYTRFSSGAEIFTNRNGRCEDAPCCGCCS